MIYILDNKKERQHRIIFIEIHEKEFPENSDVENWVFCCGELGHCILVLAAADQY
ncbi:hypothetical protein C2G38_2189233 [Gigaspora rosea]|uniref:Uncharacterized protein n=1 Tax=Gigaspora rosea TaxID=44941 RepID=A0A397V6Z5_9GLOM|nr:hypothetical protein C2G38_2189233 [Gigaspora rosea]